MFTENVTAEFAAQLESSEINAWLDLYAAAPPDFTRHFQLEIMRVQNVVLTRCKSIPFIHFNCVKNFGMMEPANESLLGEVLNLYREAEIRHFAFYHIPHSQPSNVQDWFAAKGLRQRGGWDRIYWSNNASASAAIESQDGFRVEKVTRTNGSEWAAYIDRLYGLPTSPWLLCLVERPGWHHYMLRRHGQIVAVRSFHVDETEMGWLGIEAPVPGVMTRSYDLDAQLCQAIIKDASDLGVKFVVADIEAPSLRMDTPAYRNFELLGFKRPYFRSHYSF